MSYFQLDSEWLQKVVNPSREQSCLHASNPRNTPISPGLKSRASSLEDSLFYDSAVLLLLAESNRFLMNIQPDIVNVLHHEKPPGTQRYHKTARRIRPMHSNTHPCSEAERTKRSGGLHKRSAEAWRDGLDSREGGALSRNALWCHSGRHRHRIRAVEEFERHRGSPPFVRGG